MDVLIFVGLVISMVFSFALTTAGWYLMRKRYPWRHAILCPLGGLAFSIPWLVWWFTKNGNLPAASLWALWMVVAAIVALLIVRSNTMGMLLKHNPERFDKLRMEFLTGTLDTDNKRRVEDDLRRLAPKMRDRPVLRRLQMIKTR